MAEEILIVAGEASADLLGADLVREIRELEPDARFFGVGGRRLAALGVEVFIPADRLNVVGGTDWMDKARDVLRAFGSLKREVQRRRPSLAILMDLPDFNLRLARHLKKLGIPVVYYVSPQVWAWRRYRIRTIRRNVDKMLVVFPFEKAFYDSQNVPAYFVGHPLLEQLQRRQTYRTQDEVHASPRVAILPGSRPSELRYHAPLVRGLVEKLKIAYPTATIRIPVASTLSRAEVGRAFEGLDVEIVDGDSRDTLRWADTAVVASGTATLETAMVGTPFCLFYRMSPSTAWIIRNIIRYRRYFGMPNLLQGREVVREFLHEKATAEALFTECRWMLEDERYRRHLADSLGECRKLLGEPGASRRAAIQVVQVLHAPQSREASLVPSPV